MAAGGLPATANTESWNGSAWSELNNLNTARYATGAAGTPSHGLAFGGSPASPNAITEDWNGASWVEVADLNTARDPYGGGAGSATAAVAFGGWITAATAATEEWSGSSSTTKVLTD